jgi:2-haloacid dehalogenase
MTASRAPRIVVFDIGGVLIEWDPRHLYRTLIADEAAMEDFLATVCTPAWNQEQDAGRPWEEAVAELTRQFPDKAELIAAYHLRWNDMVPGPVPGTADLLRRLKAHGVPVYAITNFSTEKFVLARQRFDFLNLFDGVVVSGEVRLIKPDPAIYRRLFSDFGLDPADTLFIDDVEKNVAAARAVGMHAVRFTDAATLEKELAAHGLL